MGIVQPILYFGRTQPNAAALVEDERVITYRELAGLILRTATHLTRRGLKIGDRVGLSLRDGSDHLIALLAVAAAGATAAPLDWRAPPMESAQLIAGLDLTCIL